ncbi:OmpA family protein [Acidovorax sp. SUPP2522]|uniref:OmpA family protein n=1 Tax=unclassified Acidovorax TaxID=2684926 RepID=UPI00234AEC97|nr:MULTISPECIES: OmpA family protein [unclassified Acidovorax]WCM98153.1 OmpA family protein [Acidovorax sp. GBBC 1281]GKT18156.1 OmpA family protein [Acidovorax sp. SUPP2522]
MQSSNLRRTSTLAAALLAAGLLAACASPGPLPAVEQARSAVNRAATDPAVNQYAQLELKAATDTLARADHVLRDEKDESEANHLAYLATQRAAIATNTAQARRLDAEIKQAGSETDRLRLEARTREAEASARNAQVAQARAMTAEQLAAQQQAQARAAQDRVRHLEAQLREIEGQQTERGLLVTLGDVLFAFNKADLSAQAGPRLDKLANFLKQFPERKLLIEGYTDSVGSDSYNQELSERRAQAVRDALVQRGVDTSRITARGYGKSYPVAENGSPEGRAMNRRVEIVIADAQGNLKGR